MKQRLICKKSSRICRIFCCTNYHFLLKKKRWNEEFFNELFNFISTVSVCVLVQSSTATLPTHQPQAPLHFLLLLFLIAVFILFYFYFSSKPFNLNPILCLYFPLFFFFYSSLLILLLSLLVSKSLYICTPFVSISSLSASFSL